jgi:demethylmenaquinone methyltransferase/2-methoxy-6-polyprenyl-1,4-benzoquinol methylase
MRDDALDVAGVEDGDRVLDVGCGTGFATAGLLDRGADVDALDQSPHQLAQALAKDAVSDARFVLGDAEHLPYADGAFDVVWSSGSIEYWPRPVATLRELRRVTRDGGTVLVVGPKRPGNRVLGWLADRVMLFYTEDDATAMFEEAGWREIEHTVMGSEYVDDDAIVTRATK